ncbi:MAG: hemerythrin domain-containing protein [Tannerellaceae bacterium]|nr:hemerythrin domain-containing protein [Tannerellaceae bacterium]
MKAADLALANYRLLYVFPCFGLGLGLGEMTVRQMCERNGISTPLFLLVCNLYSFDDYFPDMNVLTQIPLADLMLYLGNSHRDYLKNRIPAVIDKVVNLMEDCKLKNGKILMEFCEKYRQEVVAHLKYEEETVFPYIRELLGGSKATGYQIKEYELNHSNIDDALNDLKNILIKYLPPDCSVEKCRNVLIELFLFDSDLRKHTLLEDQILMTLVERIEKNSE